MSEPPASLGAQIDALVSHLGDDIGRLAADLAHANGKIEALSAKLARLALAGGVFVSGAAFIGVTVAVIAIMRLP